MGKVHCPNAYLQRCEVGIDGSFRHLVSLFKGDTEGETLDFSEA